MLMIAFLFGIASALALAYATSARVRSFVASNRPAVVTAITIAGASVPAAFSGASASITVDFTPFFDALNQYLPTFVGIFGLIGGIIAALGFARYIINTITHALSNGGG